MKPDKETLEILKGLKMEIGANGVLNPLDDFNKGFNEGIKEALKFINNYINGNGLFQIKE